MAVLRDLEPTQRCAGSTTLALSGIVVHAENSHLTRALARRLVQSGIVVVDTSKLRLQSGVVPTFFSNALIRAGGWPAARLILAGVDARLNVALARSGVARDVLLVDDVTRAQPDARIRPGRIVRRLYLSGRPSVSRAVAVVGSVGLEWAVPAGVVADARQVVGELVGNAVRHARTASVLQVSSDPAGLRIAVRDFGAREIGAPRRGLGLVSSLTTYWGVTPHADGKSVWALLGNKPAS
jgi:hypothetical protein